MNTTQLQQGAHVGQFEIVRCLAKGGMGSVYEARQIKLARLVALKVLSPELAKNSLFVELFRREGHSMAQLEHPNIVTVYDADVADGVSYIAMQLVAGGTLQEKLASLDKRQEFLPLATVLDVLRQVGGALRYAHQRGIVHRDIKPSNILCAPNGQFLLTDFGIAVAARASAALTMSFGTVQYTAPEQADAKSVGKYSDIDSLKRSDIYALGVLMYCLLTNRPPFGGTDAAVIRRRHAEENFPAVTRRDAPAGLLNVMKCAAAKNPAQRYASVSELLHDLEAAKHARPHVGISPVVVKTAVGVSLAAIGLGVALLLSGSDPDSYSATPPATPDLQPSPAATVQDAVQPTAFTRSNNMVTSTPEPSATAELAAPTATLNTVASTPTLRPTTQPTLRPMTRTAVRAASSPTTTLPTPTVLLVPPTDTPIPVTQEPAPSPLQQSPPTAESAPTAAPTAVPQPTADSAPTNAPDSTATSAPLPLPLP